MNKRLSQVDQANRTRARYEAIWKQRLRPWIDDVVSSYRPGKNRVDKDDQLFLVKMIGQIMSEEIRYIMKFDIRTYKAEEDVNALLRLVELEISNSLNKVVDVRKILSAKSISNSVGILMAWSESIGTGIVEQRAILKNYLYNHRLIIAVQESGFTDEIARKIAVRTVADPMTNSLLEIIKLIENDNIPAARKLSAQVMRLAKLPLSNTQREVVNLLVTPLNQAGTVTALRSDAARLQKQRKAWRDVGDGLVRDTHKAANNQTRELEEPFSVGGYAMQYPQDGSLGAAGKEIFGCRCVTEYV